MSNEERLDEGYALSYRADFSARYHRRRASFLKKIDTSFNLLVLIAGTGGFVSLMGSGPDLVARSAALTVSIVAICQIVLGIGSLAERHAEWMRRWDKLANEIRGSSTPTQANLLRWDDTRAAIEGECVTELKALAVDCENDARRFRGTTEGIRRIRPLQKALIQLGTFQSDFPSHIDTPEQLEQLCQQLGGSPWLALDTEFVREKSYYPQFCLLQISNGEIAASIDPLKIDDLEPLVKLLFNPGCIKVFHAGRQDLEIFYLLWGKIPAPLFDTQLAAALLGHGDQIGYGNLVQELLDLQLDKGHSRTDWSRRPLHPEQLRYALDDVIYLGQLYLKLSAQLKAQGRDSWLLPDFEMLADPATYQPDNPNAWQRVKGRQRLKGVQLAVLQSLACWRETEAQHSDKPKRWILKDEVLVDLARRQPDQLTTLEQIRGLEPGTIKRRGEQLLKLIAEARQLPREQWPREKRRGQKLSANQEAQVDLLHAALRLLAAEQQITHSAVATRKDLEQLVSGERETGLLKGWRRVVAGEALLQTLEGKRRLEFQQDGLVLTGLSAES